MRRLDFKPLARADIKSIRDYSRRTFGPGAQRAYGVLMQRAFNLLRTNPTRPNVHYRDDLTDKPYLFHLRHARKRGLSPKEPRHILVFSFDDETLTILRVLHDAMDVAEQMEDDA